MNPPSGVASDLIGARRVLLVVVVGSAALRAMMQFVNSYEQLVVRNLVFGAFFGGLWGPCNRMIAIWLPPRDRAHFAAVWMTSTLFSFVLSNPVGLLIAEHRSCTRTRAPILGAFGPQRVRGTSCASLPLLDKVSGGSDSHEWPGK